MISRNQARAAEGRTPGLKTDRTFECQLLQPKTTQLVGIMVNQCKLKPEKYEFPTRKMLVIYV